MLPDELIYNLLTLPDKFSVVINLISFFDVNVCVFNIFFHQHL